MDLGPLELIVILAVVIMIFGVGKLPQIGSALGKSIREFRDASQGDEDTPEISEAKPSTPTAAARDAFCTQCGTVVATNVNFCTACGHPVTRPATP